MRWVITAIIWVVTFSNAAILEFELPNDVTIEEYLEKSYETEEVLSAYALSEVNSIELSDEFYVVLFTKNGEIISPETKIESDNSNSKNEIKFVISGDWWKQNPGAKQWFDWHVYECLDQGETGAYHICKDIYGEPSTSGEVSVVIDSTLETEGVYLPYFGSIILKRWRYDSPNSREFHNDCAVLTGCMLYAFRGMGNWYYFPRWDHFGEGMHKASLIDVQNTLADSGVEVLYSNVHHWENDTESPFFTYREMFNRSVFGTRLPRFGAAESQVNAKLAKFRRGTCGYLWWQLLHKDPDYINTFNGNMDEWLSWTWGHDKLKDVAISSYSGGPFAHYRTIEEWFDDQSLLKKDPPLGYVIAPVVEKMRLHMFLYYRNSDGSEIRLTTGNPAQLEREDFDNSPISLRFIDYGAHDGGYHYLDYDFYGNNTGGLPSINKVEISADLDPPPGIVIGNDVGDEEYDMYMFNGESQHYNAEFSGIVDDFLNGTVYINEGHNTYTALIRYGAFIKSPHHPDPPKEGDYCLHFHDNNGILIKHKDFIKDSSIFNAYAYIDEDSPGPYEDKNNNEIPDDYEIELASKFMPYVIMHAGNAFIPAPVEVTLDLGSFAMEKRDSTGEIVDTTVVWPREYGDGMKGIFEDYRQQWQKHPHYQWDPYNQCYWLYRVCFTKVNPYYTISRDTWHEFWYKIWEGQDYIEPTTYVNLYWEKEDFTEDQVVIQYWFFYPFNDWGNWHEGDWEHINVLIDDVEPSAADMIEVNYYFHKHYRQLIGEQIPKVDGTHPVVYIGGRYAWPKDNENDTIQTNNSRTNYNGNLVINSHPVFSWKAASGGSYWSYGHYGEAGPWGADEEIDYNETSREYEWYDIKGILWELDKSVKGAGVPDINNYDAYWNDFPGYWGRPAESLWGTGWLKMEAPPGPIAHGCYGEWVAPGYSYYGGGPDPSPNTLSVNTFTLKNEDFELANVYPNPANNDEVTFFFTVPESCRAKLVVYDIKGRVVAIPFDADVKKGEYSATLNIESLSAGIYIYRLRADTFTDVKKLLILK